MRRVRTALWIVLAVLFSLVAAPALAGGWAVITLDGLPAEIVAGKPVEISFMVRQHGVRPFSAPDVRLQARHTASRESLEVMATAGEREGHFRASVTFPEAGEWTWSIRSGLYPEWQPMPALTVQGPASQASSTPVFPWWAAVSALGLAGAAVAAVVLRHKPAWAAALALAAVLAGGAGLAAGRAAPAPTYKGTDSLAEHGRSLFIAKGCVVCHNHRGLAPEIDAMTSVGPDLSTYQANPKFLQVWLKDPAAVKRGTQMPNLELKEEEIEALIAFLSAEP